MAPKKVLIALPPGLLAEVDQMAVAEYRTRSDLIREALRLYKQVYLSKQHPINGKATKELDKAIEYALED
jgi:metal-responsive CopG/Arc/MetJ family transcriptional regulator